MLVNDTENSLALAREHTRRLLAEAAAERLGGAHRLRHGIAHALRWLADRLDAATFTPRPIHH